MLQGMQTILNNQTGRNSASLFLRFLSPPTALAGPCEIYFRGKKLSGELSST
jgi:hypothetical protein